MPNEKVPDSFAEFIDGVGDGNWSVVIANRTAPEAIRGMFEELFESLDIDFTEVDSADTDDDVIVLLRDGNPVATSSFRPILDTLLLVNSDFYTTGAVDIHDINPPDILIELSETVFTLQGYPASNVEKLVLILVSRYIEQLAMSQQTGTLRTSFQRLSRLDDERGTKTIYERLGQYADLDVHVYGVPDWDPPASMGVSAHGIAADEIKRSWFVVYQNGGSGNAAMLAIKTNANEWRGFWTFDTAHIKTLNQYVTESF